MSQERTAWTWRHAITKSDLPSTTRHVLLTISLFMNDLGGGCYPTIEQICEASALSKRAVLKHLDIAVSQGWIIKSQHGFKGQKWRNNEYKAAWPETKKSPSDLVQNEAPNDPQNEDENGGENCDVCDGCGSPIDGEGGARGAPDGGKGGARGAQRWCTRCKKVVHEVHTTSPYTNPYNNKRESARAAGDDGGYDPRRFGDPKITLQNVLDPLTAKRFADHCAAKGRRLSPQTAESLANILKQFRERGGNAAHAIDHVIAKGWTSFELEWLENALLRDRRGREEMGAQVRSAAPQKETIVSVANQIIEGMNYAEHSASPSAPREPRDKFGNYPRLVGSLPRSANE